MNIILTGERQIGKSTAIEEFLRNYIGSVSGFYTRFKINKNTASRELYIMDINKENPARVVSWKNGSPFIDIEAFDDKGCQFLNSKADIIVMDELGKFELNALKFRAAVTAAFDSPVPVLAAVRLDALGWMQDTKSRDDVTVITVNEENRDRVPDMVRSHLYD